MDIDVINFNKGSFLFSVSGRCHGTLSRSKFDEYSWTIVLYCSTPMVSAVQRQTL